MKKMLVVLMGVFMLSGCATYYPVHINGYLEPDYIAKPFAKSASFFVMPQLGAANQIFESQIKSKIERLLQQAGYQVSAQEDADYFINYSYSLGPGKTVMEERPIYEPGDTEPVYTYRAKGKTRVSYVTYPGYTSYVPYWHKVYTASLFLEVMDAAPMRNDNTRHQVWIGEAHTVLSQPDLREALDYLLSGIFEYFGTDTGRSVTVNIGKENPLVKDLES